MMFASYDYIIDEDGNERYGKNSLGIDEYRDTTDKIKIFARNKGVPYYARVEGKDEYYPVIDGVEIVIDEVGHQKYARAVGMEIYPHHNGDKCEYVLFDSAKKPKYAVNALNEFYYPKDDDFNELVQNNEYIYNDDGSVKYPVNSFGYPIYPKNPNTNDEYYVLDKNGKKSIGKIGKNHFYAKKYIQTPEGIKELDFYPDDGGYGYDDEGKPIYIVDYNGNIVFPKNAQNDEYYLKLKDSDYLISEDEELPRYARNVQKDEIYPKIVKNNKKMEKYLNNTYAKNAKNEIMYPLDEFSNEYTLDSKLDDATTYPLGYPITFDSLIIIPQIENKPYFLRNQVISKGDIVSKLIREIRTDFLTNIASLRKPRVNNGPAYITLLCNDFVEKFEYTLDAQGNQKYQKDASRKERYIDTNDVSKIFAKRDNVPYYARDASNDEYYPVIFGEQILINGKYAETHDGIELYPKNELQNEYVIMEGNVPKYAKKQNKPYYPKDSKNNEFVVNNVYIYDADGSVKYPKDKDEYFVYPKDQITLNEYYIIGTDNKYTIILEDGIYSYARESTSQRQIYPPDNSCAYNGDIPIYAKDEDLKIIYPRNANNDEYYLKFKNSKDDCMYADLDLNLLSRYAQDHLGNDIYPKTIVPQLGRPTEIILNEMYAKTANNEFIYPLDEYNNEYTIVNEMMPDVTKYPLGYPQTFDNFIILPNVNSKPYILKNMSPNIPKSLTLYTLKRYISTDFVTEIVSSRISKVKNGFPYNKILYKAVSKNKNISLFITVFISFVSLFCLFYFIL